MTPLFPGDPAPDLTLPAETFFASASAVPCTRLAELRGQPVLLAFSPPGWDPARAERLTQINRVLSASGFSGELIGISQTGPWCRATLAEEQMQFPLLSGQALSQESAERYGVSGRHALFVLDEAGIIRWRYVAEPGISPRAEDLLAGLQSLSKGAQAIPLSPTTALPVSAPRSGLTRREFVAAALGVALALALPPLSAHADDTAAPMMLPLHPPTPIGTVPVTLHVNGTAYPLQIEPRVTLLDALRDRIGLTGSKKGCDHGQCGACTVHADGRRINSCLALAVAYQGKQITTIEGLAHGDTLHPVQAAFIQHDGFQCGFCTSGQIMSGAALLSEPVGPEDADVRESMSGNLCRCGAYPNIVAAIQDVRKGGANAPV